MTLHRVQSFRMTVLDLVGKLYANEYRTDAVARIVGYVYLIQKNGWDGLKLSRQAKHSLNKTFKSLGVNPETISL